MGISKKPPKPFPIQKGVACQLKWTQSTIYLTDGISASCHKAGFGRYLTDGGINFHNTPNKLEEDRWPSGIKNNRVVNKSDKKS